MDNRPDILPEPLERGVLSLISDNILRRARNYGWTEGKRLLDDAAVLLKGCEEWPAVAQRVEDCLGDIRRMEIEMSSPKYVLNVNSGGNQLGGVINNNVGQSLFVNNINDDLWKKNVSTTQGTDL